MCGHGSQRLRVERANNQGSSVLELSAIRDKPGMRVVTHRRPICKRVPVTTLVLEGRLISGRLVRRFRGGSTPTVWLENQDTRD